LTVKFWKLSTLNFSIIQNKFKFNSLTIKILKIFHFSWVNFSNLGLFLVWLSNFRRFLLYLGLLFKRNQLYWYDHKIRNTFQYSWVSVSIEISFIGLSIKFLKTLQYPWVYSSKWISIGLRTLFLLLEDLPLFLGPFFKYGSIFGLTRKFLKIFYFFLVYCSKEISFIGMIM